MFPVLGHVHLSIYNNIELHIHVFDLKVTFFSEWHQEHISFNTTEAYVNPAIIEKLTVEIIILALEV